jgi:trigger factor
MPEKTLPDLREALAHQIAHEKEHELEAARESQVIKFLHEHIDFELPLEMLKQETRNTLSELVRRNRERGVPDEALKEKEGELIQAAGNMAKHRLKTDFILHRIAEVEKIKVTREDIDERVRHEAMHHDTTPEKMRHEIEQHGNMDGLIEQILLAKTIAFLASNANVESAPSAPVPEQISESK